MDTVLHNQRFNKLANIVCIAFKVLFALCISAMAILAVIIAVLSFTSNDTIHSIITSNTIQASISFQGLSVQINPEGIVEVSAVKSSLLVIMLLVEVMLSFVLFITYQLKSMIGIMKDQTPFSNECVKCIERIAYGIMVISFSVELVKTSMMFFAARLFDFEKSLQALSWVKEVKFSFVGVNWAILLAGLVILIIAKVFKYGVYLKEEYDATV